MDAIILAAGRGERLRDLTPAFHKPLLPIDGLPLILRAVNLAMNAQCKKITVVVAPANAEAIAGVLSGCDVELIIQRIPRGPGDALRVGLEIGAEERVLVLLADNVSSDGDVAGVAAQRTAIGVKEINRREAQRFTRWEDDRWVEKVPLSPYGSPALCWVGPFVGLRKNMIAVLEAAAQKADRDDINITEIPIGPYLDQMMHDGKSTVIAVSSYDVGTLDSYPKNGVTR